MSKLRKGEGDTGSGPMIGAYMSSPEGKKLMRTFANYQQSQWRESPSAIGPKSRAWSPQKQEMSLLASNAKENASIAARNAAMLGAGIMQSLPSLARAGSSVGRLAYQGLKDAYRSYQNNKAKEDWANENYPAYLESQKDKERNDAYNNIGKRMSKGMMCKCGSGMSKAMCNCGANKNTGGSMKKGINLRGILNTGRKIKNQALKSVVNYRRNQMSGMIGDGHQIADDVYGNLQDIAYFANKLGYSGAIKNPKVNRALSRMDGLINYNNMDNSATYRNRQVPGFEAFAYELGNKKSKLQNAILGTGAAALGYSLLNRNRQEQKAPMSGPMKKGINWAKLTSRALHGGADVVRDTASKVNQAIGYGSFAPGTMNRSMRRGRITLPVEPRVSRVASAPNRFSIRQNGWNALDAIPMRATYKRPFASMISDAQAKKISRLAGRAYDFGEEQLARRSDELLDPRMASAFNNRTNRAINNTSKILAPLAALALGSRYIADNSKSKLRSAASSRGVSKRMSTSSRNKYGT
jgi:hypothetical protein